VPFKQLVSTPIVAADGICGAITVVRCGMQDSLGFRELGILSQIGELTGAAADRLRGHQGGPIAGRRAVRLLPVDGGQRW
jgi:hypothetical protein